MCSKRLGPQSEVGDTVVFAWLFVFPTPSGGWGHGWDRRAGWDNAALGGCAVWETLMKITVGE